MLERKTKDSSFLMVQKYKSSLGIRGIRKSPVRFLQIDGKRSASSEEQLIRRYLMEGHQHMQIFGCRRFSSLEACSCNSPASASL
jgi:hypothetical protein